MTGHWNSSLGKVLAAQAHSTRLITLDVKEMLPRVTGLALHAVTHRPDVGPVDDVDLHLLHEAVHCV